MEESGLALRVLPRADGGLVLPDGVTLNQEELSLVSGGGVGWVERGDVIRFRALPGEARYTTALQLERERVVLAAVGTPSPVSVDNATMERSIDDRGLDASQAGAMRRLGEEPGRVVALVGPGGSGKTYSVGAYADAVEAAGHRVIGVATSAAAAGKLGEDLGERWSGTIAMLRHEIEQTQVPLAPHTVVVVDEASMVSTRDLAWLVDQVNQVDGKLVLMGDPKQLPSVDSGRLFHRIVATGDGVVDDLLEVNQRQRHQFDRDVLNRLRTGDVRAAVRDYAEAGRLHVGNSEYATKAAMVDAWWSDVQTHGVEQVRMLASRHDEVWMLNDFARVQMQTNGRLTGPVVANRWGVEFQSGDRIVVRDNWYSHSDLRNGQTGTVVSVDPQTGSVTFRREIDNASVELPKRYVGRNVQHAYAQTIHTAQGQTFEVTHAYGDAGVKAEHGYTALSRARGETHLWVADAPTYRGECAHVHGTEPLQEDRIQRLINQLSETVIDRPAVDQGMPVESATDRDLIRWRDELTHLIETGPLGVDFSEQIVALEAAIDDARLIADRMGTSGARAQVSALETELANLQRHAQTRLDWIEAHTDDLHRYSTVREEIGHRVHARLAAYEVSPPVDLVEAIGRKPAEPEARRQWSAAAMSHAEARLVVGLDADLSDPAVLHAGQWRRSAEEFNVGRSDQLERIVPRARFGS